MRTAIELEDVIFGTDASKRRTYSQCSQQVDIQWVSDIGSSVYQTPQIVDLFGNGKKQVVVPTFVKFLDVLNGEDGSSAQGWPFTHRNFATHASPLLFDFDRDGRNEVVIATVNGEIVFFRDNGEPLYGETLQVPRLKVRKHWFEGLDDVLHDSYVSLHPIGHTQQQQQSQDAGSEPASDEPLVYESSIEDESVEENSTAGSSRKLLQVDPETSQQGSVPDVFGNLSDEARESMSLLLHSDDPSIVAALEDKSANPFHSPRHEAVRKREDEDRQKNSADYVWVDPHVLATPVLVDIDGDGNEDLVLGVSYYFEKDHYMDPKHAAELDTDIDIRNYVAGGIVVFDLRTKEIKWTAHLDLTTDRTRNRAYIYASPTVVDLDGDGDLEVILPTSMGFIYAFSNKGELRPKFPLWMSEIQGQVITADINGNGLLDICAVDFKANLVCFDSEGTELWDRQLSGSCAQAPTVGDIDGDGQMELVVGTTTGHIWAVSGKDGSVKPGFPIKTDGSILAQALLVRLNESSTYSGQHIVMPSFDGYLYIIDGMSNCVHKVDIGENVYAMVLADDVTGDGKLDLVLSSMNGNVYCLSTGIRYHPLKAWTSQTQELNGFTAKEGHQGIFVTDTSRRMRDIVGGTFNIEFEILDNMPKPKGAKYHVKIMLGQSIVLLEKDYRSPGVYVETVQAPSTRVAAVVKLEMTNVYHQVFTDSFTLTFHFFFHRIVKWALLLPFLAITGFLVLSRSKKQDKQEEEDLFFSHGSST